MNANTAISRTEKRRLEFQDRIKDAALKLFKRNGITNTTIASIIKEADIAHKTFFNHFPSKHHLLEFLVSETMREAFGGIGLVEESKASPQQKIGSSFMKIARAMAKMDDGVKEVISYYFIGIEGPKEIRHEHTGRFFQYVRSILEEAKQDGQLTLDYSVDSLAEIVVGLYSSTVMNWVSHDDYPLIEKMQVVIQFINDMVFEN